jgi:hypothetical protein
MRTKRFLVGASAGVIALSLAGACAAQVKALEPKLELRNAFTALADAKQAGFTVKLTGSADELIAGFKLEAAKNKDADAAFTDDDAKSVRTVFNSSLTLAYDQAGDGAEDDRMLLAATVDGVTGTELRVVDGTAYLKAPVAELAAKFGAGAADVDAIRKEVAADLPAVGAFFDGKWVSVDVKEATRLSGTAVAGLPSAAPEDADKMLAEVKTSATNLLEGAEIVRDTADDKHLIVTSSTTKAYAEAKRLVTAVSGELGADVAKDFGDAPKDRPIVLDLWIDDDKLSAVELNVLQFIDGAGGRAAVRLETTTGAPIDAPQDATKVDVSALSKMMPTGVSAGLGSGPSIQAETLGYAVLMRASMEGGAPASYLKKAIAETKVPARIVRRGVAEVTVGGMKACLTLPKNADGDPVVKDGAC